MELHELEIGDARAGVDTPSRCRRRSRPRGFVVSRNTCPAPPVASSTRRGARRRDAGRRRQEPRADAAAVLDHQLDDPRVVVRPTVGSCDARSHRTRPISRPVASRACSTRRTLCAPSHRQRRRAVGSTIERRAPATSARGRKRGPSSTSTLTAALVAQTVAGRQRVGGMQRPACRRRRRPRRCRPARSRCCFRRVRLWSG